MTHNSGVDEGTGGAAADGEPGAPAPVPELSPSPARSEVGPGEVPAASGLIRGTDREAYARLLDRAHARELLNPVEYQLRLAELADAGTVEEMKRIVTDLPALAGVNGAAGGNGAGPRSPTRSDRRSTGLAAWPGVAGYRVSRRRAGATPGTRPWTVLALVMVVVILVFALLVVYADRVVHESHTRSGSLPAAVHPAPVVGTA